MTTQIILTEKRLSKNPNTKTTYILDSEETKEIDRETFDRITNEGTIKWFRRLGGTETAERGYTYEGYLITKLTSTSPDRQSKTIREFKFKK